MKTPSFRLGITMAGAVSAGAYTAGFMDYLIESLELWQTAKESNNKLGKDHPEYDHSIPMHDVIIDVIGGASAGGMVSVMTALNSFQNMPHVTSPKYKKTGNIFYDSWVLLDDDIDFYNSKNSESSSKLTFEKMLDIEDLDKHEKGIPSLLNSVSIERIAENVFSKLEKHTEQSKASFYSDDLRVLITLCSLEGIPFELQFEHLRSKYFENVPGHRMHEHMLVAHFKKKFDPLKDKDKYLHFDPFEKHSRELIKKCTIGTGAFPLGLKAVHFENEFTTEYIKTSIKRNLQSHHAKNVNILLKGEYFNFTNVDGGTINNEPYGEVVSVLKKLHGEPNTKLPMYGTIMIDPFPNFADRLPDENGSFQKTVFEILPKVYTTLRQQVRIKRGNTFFEDIFRLLVFPVKWKKKGELTDHPPLACGAIDGFGGFFDIEFRIHDFFLGRDNARNFLRYFFSFEYDKNDPHPLFKDISIEAKERFAHGKKNEKIMLPIIPDVRKKIYESDSPFSYTVPDFPTLNTEMYNKYKKPLKKRIRAMIKKELKLRMSARPILRKLFLLLTNFTTILIYKRLDRAIKHEFRNRKML
jgi:hypothetical protein